MVSKKWLFWLPALLCMALIFAGSTHRLSSQRTSRILVPLLKSLFPNISAEAVGNIQFIIRKGGHVSEFTILSMLYLLAIRKMNQPVVWSWAQARLAFLLTTLYAATDELHQSFEPTRQGLIGDVAIDSIGAAVGVGLWYLYATRGKG